LPQCSIHCPQRGLRSVEAICLSQDVLETYLNCRLRNVEDRRITYSSGRSRAIAKSRVLDPRDPDSPIQDRSLHAVPEKAKSEMIEAIPMEYFLTVRTRVRLFLLALHAKRFSNKYPLAPACKTFHS